MATRSFLTELGVGLRRNGLWLTALLTVGVFVGLSLFGDVTAVMDAFAAFEWRVLPLVLALATAGYLLRFLKWEFYLRTLSIDVPLRTSAIVFFSGLMLVVTPGKVGEVWKAWFLKDLQGVPASQVTSVVAAERLTDFLALGLMASLGILVYQRSIVLVMGLFATVGVGLVLIQWHSMCLRFLGALDAIPVLNTYATAAEELYESAHTLFQPRPLVGAMILSVTAWTIEAIAMWVVLFGYGVGGSVFQSVFIYGFGLIFGAISMLPGGLGATEASMVGLLLSFGYDRTIAVSTVLVIRVGTLWYAVILGLLVYIGYATKMTAGAPERDD